MSEFITIAETASLLGVCDKTVRRRIADGSLRGYRFGTRAIRLDRSEVLQALRPIPTAGRAA